MCPIFFVKPQDELIAKTGLTWGTPESSIATSALRDSIKRMVIDVLASFGAVECEYQEEPLGKETIPKLDTFAITPLGNVFLQAVAIGAREIL